MMTNLSPTTVVGFADDALYPALLRTHAERGGMTAAEKGDKATLALQRVVQFVVQCGELRVQIIGYNFDSLNRHGITPAMIEEVLAGSMISFFSIDEADSTCEMLVGYTFTEQLLEIGLRYKSAEEVFIFHAQTVSPQYRRLYEKDWDNG